MIEDGRNHKPVSRKKKKKINVYFNRNKINTKYMEYEGFASVIIETRTNSVYIETEEYLKGKI